MSGTGARRPRSLASEQPASRKGKAALSLPARVSRGDAPLSEGFNEDHNACCRAYGGPVGSPEFVACRNDRDTQRSAALARADRRQRDLAEYMMNHPDHP